MDEELPKGVTTQKTPDGRTSVWFFPIQGIGIWHCIMPAVIFLVFYLLFLILEIPPPGPLALMLCVPISYIILQFNPYLSQRNTTISVTGVAVFRDALPRLGFAWDEVSSLHIMRDKLNIRNNQNKRTSVRLDVKKEEDYERSVFLCRLVGEKMGLALERKIKQSAKEQKPIEVSLPKPALDVIQFVFSLFLASLFLCHIFLVPRSGIQQWVIFALLVLCAASHYISKLTSVVKCRKFGRLEASAEGISLLNEGQKYFWEDVTKVDLEGSDDSRFPITPPLKIWFADNETPLVIPPGANNYNLLVALLKHKKLI